MELIRNPYLLKRKIIKFLNLVFLRPFFKKYGKGTRIESAYYLTPQYIKLGKNVLISKNARIEGVSFYEGFSFSPSIILEDFVSIQQNLHLTCANNITIKKHTAIAANVTITDIIHPYEDILTPIEKQPIQCEMVEIGEECKIYNNVVILPGVILGKHCVVAANSVVRKGVYPQNSIIAGTPAKIISQFKVNKWTKL
jgi:acetyltransferase-like isoleucine patch superfamily enzyme